MALLKDSKLEAIKVCQGCSTGQMIIPLYHCQGGKLVFIIVSPSIELSKSQWMSCPRIPIEGYDSCWEGNGNHAMHYLVGQDQS